MKIQYAEDIVKLAKTVTREEFLQEASKRLLGKFSGKYNCPNSYNQFWKNIRNCNGTNCRKCWAKAIENISFKDNSIKDNNIKEDTTKLTYEDIYESGIEGVTLNWHTEEYFWKNYDSQIDELISLYNYDDDSNITYRIVQEIDKFYEWCNKIKLFIKQNTLREMTKQEAEKEFNIKITD